MEFNFSDISNLSEEELLERLDHNQRTAVFKKSELEKLKSVKNKKKIVIETPPKTFSVPKEVLKEALSDDSSTDYLSTLTELLGNIVH